ncbi:MAG: hypothetical protein OQL09_09665 [Gammaproteobacteria bacterium]|nr:hypothetical protein [Gammaproteobacteria bacterium]
MVYVAYLYYQSMEQQQNTAYLNKQQEKFQQHIQQQQLKIHQFLTDDQLQQLKQDIKNINSVANINSLDISSVFYLIELALPEDVNLEQFNYDSTSALTTLAVQSTEPELLNKFIDKLQQDPRLNQINLVDQKQLGNRRSVVFRYQMIVQHRK